VVPEEKRRKKKEKEKENRRNIILKAARRLFMDRGFKAVTVDSIAEKAEVSKGSIYLCFESKEEIYAQILIADNLALYERVKYFASIEASASQLLQEFSRIYVNYFMNDKELFRILMTFMMQTTQMNLTEKQSAELIRSTNENIKVISEIIQKGIDSGDSDILFRYLAKDLGDATEKCELSVIYSRYQLSRYHLGIHIN